MNNLYIIGNGFDLHHNLDTKYQSFAKYLAKEGGEIYDLVLNYYGLPDISEEPIRDEEYAEWARFEDALADLDYKQALDDNTDLIANPASPKFRDSDWHSFEVEMDMLVEKLTAQLIGHFNSFILNVIYPGNIDDSRIKIKDSSVFLNFNYTNTLERYYNVKFEDICYIHSRANTQDGEIVLGHGTDPKSFGSTKKEPPKGLSEHELYEWEQEMAEQYDYSYSSAEQKILSYYFKSFKNTREIIAKNSDFFKSLKSIDTVFILGHSISKVDIEYFQEVLRCVPSGVNWIVTYYSDYERAQHYETLIEMGIEKDKIHQIRINELK